VRLNAESHQQRIEALDEHIKQFRFVWDGMPLQPQVGVSYCYVRSPVNHLYLVLGELGWWPTCRSPLTIRKTFSSVVPSICSAA
jgi:hypothetical protein